MGRAKLTLELRKKEKYRNSTFLSRKSNLKKKVHELSTLCGVKAMMIIYGPKQDHPLQPDIWPEDHVKVLELINKYKVQSTDEGGKRTFSLFKFFEDRNKKAQAALTKLRKSNVQAKYPLWDERFENLSAEKLIRIATFLETRLGHAKKLKIIKEDERNYHAYHLHQQQKMLSKKMSRDFEGSSQPNKCHITTASREPIYNSYNSHLPMPLQMQIPEPIYNSYNSHLPMPLQMQIPNNRRVTTASREPIYNSYNSHLPMPLQMQVPMPMPLQQRRPTLDQCTMQRTIEFNNLYVGGAPNIIYATPLAQAEPDMAYNDPMAGMAQSISSLNNLMTAPRMHYFGDSMQSMTYSYTDGAMQPIPQSYVDYPVRSTAARSQMPAVFPCQKEDHEGYYNY